MLHAKHAHCLLSGFFEFRILNFVLDLVGQQRQLLMMLCKRRRGTIEMKLIFLHN